MHMRLFLYTNIQSNRFAPLLETSQTYHLLDKFDVQLVPKVADADAILFLVNSRRSLCNISGKERELLHTNLPLYLLERVDSAILWARELEKLPNLRLIIKNRVLRKYAYNNEATVKLRYHGSFLDPKIRAKADQVKYQDISDKLTNLPKLPDRYKTILKPALWDFHSSILSNRMKPYKQEPITWSKRTIDVFCVCSERDGLFGTARSQAKKAIQKLAKTHGLTVQTGSLDKKQYINALRNSKICVACWGFGEWVHMDGYAMYSQVALVKPNTDFVKMVPDLYQDSRYFPCKADFSDLEQVVMNLLAMDGKLTQTLKQNSEMVRDWSTKRAATKFWKLITDDFQLSTT